MMATSKATTLDIANSIPKILYERVEQKWKFTLIIDKQIKEVTLAQVMPSLDKQMISKDVEKYKGIFAPKYRAFNILIKQVEEVVTKTTLLWKSIYELTTIVVEEKGEQEKEETTKESTMQEKDDMVEE